MIKLFSWLLKRFLTAFAFLVLVQLATYILGLNLILSGYESDMLGRYERIAAEIILQPESGQLLTLPGNGPFFVYSTEKALIFTSRGKGKSIQESELKPVHHEGKFLGYFHAGELGFADNQANRVFLISIIILSALAVILSLVIGFLAALFSSRRMAKPIGLLRGDIHDIRSLKIIDARSFDINELTEMSEDVSEASRTLNAQDEYKRQWLRDLAHDLRTPLSGLKSQLEAMADGVLEPSPERFKRHLLEIERLENLAASIGELTAVESRDDIEKSKIDSEKFIKQLISPWEHKLQQSNIRLETEIDSTSFEGDEQLLLRAVGNILSNAVKYIGDGDFIKIRLSDTAIIISNNGPDIPEQQRELIFTRLYRGDAGRTSPGSGLGLSITREIVQLHGGEVRVEALGPRGASFIINLP